MNKTLYFRWLQFCFLSIFFLRRFFFLVVWIFSFSCIEWHLIYSQWWIQLIRENFICDFALAHVFFGFCFAFLNFVGWAEIMVCTEKKVGGRSEYLFENNNKVGQISTMPNKLNITLARIEYLIIIIIIFFSQKKEMTKVFEKESRFKSQHKLTISNVWKFFFLFLKFKTQILVFSRENWIKIYALVWIGHPAFWKYSCNLSIFLNAMINVELWPMHLKHEEKNCR